MRAPRLTAIAAAAGLTAAGLGAGAAAAQPAPAREATGFWERVTVAVPVATAHAPDDGDFNNQNFGLLVDVALTERWSVVGGAFRNSYDRDTAIAGLGWHPLSATVGGARLRAGALVAVDLNGGYRRYNTADPLVGAFSVRMSAAHPDRRPLTRLGLQLTVIPPAPENGSTAFNLAVTYKLR